jgi:hypothetical protein
MFFVEGSVFLFFVGGFFIWLMLSDRLRQWRDRRESQRISEVVNSLHGDEIEAVLMRFGPPHEHYRGSSGRSLYVWRRPPSDGLPAADGLLVVTLTVDPDGHVVDTFWQRR